MINFKTASSHQDSSVMKNKSERKEMKKKYRSNIHKCPVHTLLTSIFSGIAWNG